MATPITSERFIGIEGARCRICLQCDEASHLGKKLLLLELHDGVLYKLNFHDSQKKNDLPKEGEMVLQDSHFMKESARHSTGHRAKC